MTIRRLCSRCLAAALVCLPPSVAVAGLPPAAVEVVDVNAAGNPAAGIDPGWAILGPAQIFFAGGSDLGAELWTSDATPGGTTVWADLVPGAVGSDPRELVGTAGRFFFSAEDPEHGRELWSSDGTPEGTALVADIVPGPVGSDPEQLVIFDGGLYSQADDADGLRRLWRTDVATLATEQIVAHPPIPFVVRGTPMVVANGYLFFEARPDGDLDEIWVTDGTPTGTDVVTDANCSGVDALAAAPTRVYFLCEGRLYSTDGLLTGIEHIGTFPSPWPRELVVAQAPPNDPATLLFLDGSSAGAGSELWSSDGTPGGTVEVDDLLPGPSGSQPRELFAWGGGVLFSAVGPGVGRELHWSDGSTTTLVLDIHPAGDGSPANFRPHGGSVYFTACDAAGGCELWRTDGTPGTTSQVADVEPGASSSWAYPMISTPLGLAFAASTLAEGTELWGTTGAGATALSTFSSTDGRVRDVVATVEGVIFDATTAIGGEPWDSAGSPETTTLVEELTPGSPGSRPFVRGGATLPDGVTVFGPDAGPQAGAVWRSDGTEAGTYVLLPAGLGDPPRGFTTVGGHVYFAADDLTHGMEVWRTDGTPAGTQLVADVAPNGASSYPGHFVPFAGEVYFTADDGTTGTELWRTNGTEAGTELVMDAAPGAGSSVPEELVVAGGKLFFALSNAANGWELGWTDGTAAGVLDLVPGPAGSRPYALRPWGGAVAFAAETTAGDVEVFRSDGTLPGTWSLDVNPSDPDLVPMPVGATAAGIVFAVFGPPGEGRLAASGETPGSAVELGALDDVSFDDDDTFDSWNVATLDGVLYFAGLARGTTGDELWRTDGTPAGTEIVDLVPGAGGSEPRSLAVAGGRLYFAALDPALGRELHVIEGSAIFADGFEAGAAWAWASVAP